MNILITICGRAGSKGVKNKNTRIFLGYPLAAYSLAAAMLFKKKRGGDSVDICADSDSDKILDAVRQYDATRIKRPEALARDDSPKLPAIRHALARMEEIKKKRYDYILDLDITSPFRTVWDMENALNIIQENTAADVVFSVVPARRNPYFNMVERKDGKMQKILDGAFTARQQAPEVYDMNASVYCYRRDSLLNRLDQSPLDGVFEIFLMRDTAVLDIDSEEDFALMEVLGRYFFSGAFKELYEHVIRISDKRVETNPQQNP
jgi:CMP-N-acetylneuraminic acid synthetase